MDTSQVIAAYRARGVDEAAVAVARTLVGATRPAGPARARSLLWIAGRLAAWAMAVGLEPRAEVLLHPSVIERFVTAGMGDASAAARRTARTNLRFVARRVTPSLAPPAPAGLARNRAKPPYSSAEVHALLALAAAQPTEARRQRLAGLLCLGLGAGIERAELRHVTGRHVRPRSGGVVVVIEGRHPRTVPVLARYRTTLVASAAHAGAGFICGGISPTRKNLTTRLVDSTAGGTDLPRLDIGRLRATWLCEQLERLGVPLLLRAAGVTHSQRIWDLAATLEPASEATLVERLG